MHKMLNEYSYSLEKYDMLEIMKNPVREIHDKEEEATPRQQMSHGFEKYCNGWTPSMNEPFSGPRSA